MQAKALLFLFCIYPIYGQKYNTKYIINKADSILHEVVGDSLYRFFAYDTNSYYEYIDEIGETNWETLNEFSETKGKFVKVDVRFFFDYPIVKGIKGTSQIEFDKDLISQDSINLKFIPDFLKENRKCDFITSEKAIEIAKGFITQKGKYELEATLNYDNATCRYIYFIENILRKYFEKTDDESTESEFVIVDARTGKVLEHQFGQSYKRIR